MTEQRDDRHPDPTGGATTSVHPGPGRTADGWSGPDDPDAGGEPHLGQRPAEPPPLRWSEPDEPDRVGEDEHH
ncbi:MAG: hypothetical protein KF809_02730 [Chloroflexi bacterium]|nr:hypothetical protein [Chloroflexota bacterium]